MAKERVGSVIEKNGKVYARLQFKDENGKQRDLCRTADSRSDAKKKLKELLQTVEKLSAKELDAANMTVSELAKHYKEKYLHQAIYVGEIKVSGVRDADNAAYFIEPIVKLLGHRKVNAITYGDLLHFKQIRLQTPTKYDKQRSIASVNKEISKLKTMFKIAVREQWLSRSPFDNGASLIGQEEHRNRVLELLEENRLLASIESHPSRSHIRGIVLIALDCALRRGEIFKLRWSDCDMVCRTITVRAFNSKTAKKRTVAMTKRVFDELSYRQDELSGNENELVFGITDNINTAWKKICREAGIEDFHFHDTRHTSITRMIRAGLPPVEVMKISGHSTLAAFNIYANLESDSIFRAANALDNYLAVQNTQSGQMSELIN